jgi:hypothetical protein
VPRTSRERAYSFRRGPLLQTVASDKDWRVIAENVINYQRTRLEQVPAQLDFFSEDLPRELHPARLIAPALVAFSAAEDHVNHLLARHSADVATLPLSVPVIVPRERLSAAGELERVLANVPGEGVSSYLVWTPGITEERLMADRNLLGALVRLVSRLAETGIPVGHLHANYIVAALHDAGIAAVAHHLGWIDKGEPAEQVRGGLRSCQTYVPAVRHCLPFDEARNVGRSFGAGDYADRYCDCAFCVGAFAAGQHPLDLLLEDQIVTFSNGRQRRTPTSRAVTLNTWHYLLSRRQEIEAFSAEPAVDVIARDLQRAAAVADRRTTERLRRLADELLTA